MPADTFTIMCHISGFWILYFAMIDHFLYTRCTWFPVSFISSWMLVLYKIFSCCLKTKKVDSNLPHEKFYDLQKTTFFIVGHLTFQSGQVLSTPILMCWEDNTNTRNFFLLCFISKLPIQIVERLTPHLSSYSGFNYENILGRKKTKLFFIFIEIVASSRSPFLKEVSFRETFWILSMGDIRRTCEDRFNPASFVKLPRHIF